MQDVLSSADAWKFAAPLLGAVMAWFTNEWRKRLADQYLRKEAHYKELICSLRGFCVGVEKEHAMAAFVLAIRADLLSRKPLRTTSLTEHDFRHLQSK